mmetsp:Transcript_29185/g.46824  ORF Transcript_29185/g.46824 Transcript_29185/m.46824 type:complete len:248 (+) Transcript_29185:647-1390(+)
MSVPSPPSTMDTSRFCGRCLAPHTVAPTGTFSVTLLKPFSACCVRASYTVNCDSRHVTTNLFIAISFLSNSTPHTPLPTLVSQRTVPVRRSNNFTSPLSYPASTHRSSSLYELPNATLQQSRALTPSPGSKHATGASRCRTSHTRTAPSRPPVTSSGAPYPLACPPQPSMAFTIDVCALTSMIAVSECSRSHSCRYPSKLPVASCRSARPDAPNVPHLKLVFFSISFCNLSSVPASSYTWMQPVARG